MSEAEPLTTKKLAEEIAADAGIDPTKIPHVMYFIDPRQQVWKMGEAAPVKKELVIFSMFHSNEDVLVYCAPVKQKDDKGDAVPFTRFVLSRTSASLVGETMALDTFKALMSAELVGVFEDTMDIVEPGEPEPGPEPEPTPTGT